jgi:hypothetical protein
MLRAYNLSGTVPRDLFITRIPYFRARREVPHLMRRVGRTIVTEALDLNRKGIHRPKRGSIVHAIRSRIISPEIPTTMSRY